MNRRKFIAGAAALGFGAIYWPNRWEYIVVHHSAGSYGSIEFLQEVHRQRQGGDPIDAIPYHYVIGNGNGLGMGEVASDWRKDLHLWGTHLSENNLRRNVLGIGICLVGNFEVADVPQAQLDALVSLTRSLMIQYDIPLENVTGHGMIDGESTACPGLKFPLQEFKQAIA